MNIRALLLTVGTVVVVIMYIALFYWTVTHHHGPVRIDCTIAEISPDIPPKAKEECRKLRMENIK